MKLLMGAVNKKHVSMVKKLLMYGVNPNIKDVTGNTSLHIALYDNNDDIVRLLLESNADRTIPNNYGDRPIDIMNRLIHGRFLS